MFQWIFITSWPKMAVFGGQNRGRGGAMLTPNELVVTFLGCYLCPTFEKNRSRNVTVGVQTDRHTHCDRD